MNGDHELFKMEDVKVEVMRARGAGGQVGFLTLTRPMDFDHYRQHVNKTESAVRLTHTPTGVTVSMQDERSQHQVSNTCSVIAIVPDSHGFEQNKRRAFQVLRARLMDLKLTKEVADRRATRRNLVRTADRSEKIRTYNYAQDRVTDHRIGLSLMNLTSFLEGDGVQDFLDALRRNWQEEMMEEVVGESE